MMLTSNNRPGHMKKITYRCPMIYYNEIYHAQLEYYHYGVPRPGKNDVYSDVSLVIYNTWGLAVAAEQYDISANHLVSISTFDPEANTSTSVGRFIVITSSGMIRIYTLDDDGSLVMVLNLTLYGKEQIQLADINADGINEVVIPTTEFCRDTIDPTWALAAQVVNGILYRNKLFKFQYKDLLRNTNAIAVDISKADSQPILISAKGIKVTRVLGVK